jgi:hypothetical protein
MVAGYTKSLHAAFGPGVIGVLLFMYVLPVMGLFRRETRGPALAAYGAGVAGRMLVARRTGQSVPDALAHPASIATLSALWVRSVRAKRRGTLTWRGRPV